METHISPEKNVSLPLQNDLQTVLRFDHSQYELKHFSSKTKLSDIITVCQHLSHLSTFYFKL